MPILCSSVRGEGRFLSEKIDLQGHRGGRGKRPENTIPAFEYCIEHQMTTIELDTNVTRDKQLIVNHNTSVNGEICLLENGKPAEVIPIRDLTVAELKRLDCGAVADVDFPEQVAVRGTRLITLVEFFEFVKTYEREHALSDRIRFNIETKFSNIALRRQEVPEAARLVVDGRRSGRNGRTRSTVQSFRCGCFARGSQAEPAHTDLLSG